MLNYKEIELSKLTKKRVNAIYKDLLNHNYSFVLIKYQNKEYVLTKEKSIFPITNKEKFLQKVNKDIYYHTIIIDEDMKDNLENKDLKIYYEYINKYKSLMTKELYGEKYIFGSVAVRTKNNNFITTIRGKKDFKEYTIVKDVDLVNHIVKVINKKATLNAPLLAKLFTNKKVKVIVHINHYFDAKLPNVNYAFPGTVQDSMRSNKTSFNIKYHGVIYLFDEKGKIL